MILNKANAGLSLIFEEKATSGSGALSEPFSRVSRINYGIGTGAGNVSKQWNGLRTLSGSSETHDLTGGITTRSGASVTLTKIRAFYVRNLSSSATLTLGGGSNAITSIFGTTLVLPPSTEILLETSSAAGWAVTAGTGDQLQVAGAAGQQYEIAILGE